MTFTDTLLGLISVATELWCRQVLFFPLALRGKAFGFSVLQEHAVMTPVISIFFAMLIIRYLSIHISIKK